MSKGYAVMCMTGLPEHYSRRLKIDRARTAGSHVIHRACLAGYDYVLSKYNVRHDGCYLLSVSTGGLAALNILNLSDIPVLAAAGINPLTSTAENAWHVPSGSSSGGEFDSLQYRSNIIRIFGMKDAATLSELENARYEKDKVGIYDPYDYCLNRSDKPLRAPYLVFSHTDDKVVRRGIVDTLACVMNARREGSVLVSDVQEYGHGIDCPQEFQGVLLFDGHIHRINLTTRLIFMFFEKYRYGGARAVRGRALPAAYFSEHTGDVLGRVPGGGKP